MKLKCRVPGSDVPGVLRLHGSCAVRNGIGVLLLGQPGCGKSDLLLRLIDRGFGLVADDQVLVEAGQAAPAPALAGLIELRGIGLLRMGYVTPVPLGLVMALDDTVAGLGPAADRMPEPRVHPMLGLPMLRIAPFAASAAFRTEIALDCVGGDRVLHVGGLHASEA